MIAVAEATLKVWLTINVIITFTFLIHPLVQNVDRGAAMAQDCNAFNYQYADAKHPLVSTAIVEWQDAIPSSIITLTHRAHTVAFVGTAHGDLIKVRNRLLRLVIVTPSALFSFKSAADGIQNDHFFISCKNDRSLL